MNFIEKETNYDNLIDLPFDDIKPTEEEEKYINVLFPKKMIPPTSQQTISISNNNNSISYDSSSNEKQQQQSINIKRKTLQSQFIYYKNFLKETILIALLILLLPNDYIHNLIISIAPFVKSNIYLFYIFKFIILIFIILLLKNISFYL
jgi:Ca2+-dependent lipid-binding protein